MILGRGVGAEDQMLKLLQMIFLGHVHEWEIIDKCILEGESFNPHAKEMLPFRGRRYTLR